MMDFVVDTDVASYQHRSSPLFAPYERYFQDARMVISFMTYAELLGWGKQNAWGAHRLDELRREVKSRYVVFHVSDALCEIWSDVKRQGRDKGRQIATADAWIAATAIYLDLPLISNNRRDYDAIDGLQLITHAPA